ncbi:hypothetical protein ACFQKF_12555 [Halalkalicoccus sp. GCM10025322]|uniref:hypothetical protein n=1 Tax=Halalkalicoccus TaxID=332246 RepID=UPI002F963629
MTASRASGVTSAIPRWEIVQISTVVIPTVYPLASEFAMALNPVLPLPPVWLLT